MFKSNQTVVTEFLLLGFPGLKGFKPVFFLLMLTTYMITLTINLFIIILVSTTAKLNFPMYFFLKHLSLTKMAFLTTVVPKMLHIILKDEGRLSLYVCITQLYCVCICSYLQCFLIAIMSYDRYLAICNPLRYTSLMNSHVCFQVIIGLCFFVTILVSSEMIVIYRYDYCGLNSIDHFYCDFYPLIELSSSDTSGLKLQDFIISIITICLPFAFIIMTYIFIIIPILKISSVHGRRKAFSTCSSHVTLVGAFYGTFIIVYMTPPDEASSHLNKYRSLLYLAVSPLINPIIYSLRNHEIKAALQKTLADFRNLCPKVKKLCVLPLL
ncbi:unnamed protein product [Staurois parvus]|uniref:G-protein coupled receptors family 1 profile domain-containing protein n=1 Tax=Staurois parvus TaxID=386267 RepID=A0ABN9DDQ6_9NEOB|nr:unnamed protein product [Staurois parvus]